MNRTGSLAPARRGGALITLGGIIAIWLMLRVAVWEAPFAPSSLTALTREQALAQPGKARLDMPANPLPPNATGLENLPQMPDAPLPQWNPAPLLPALPPPIPEPADYSGRVKSANTPLAHCGSAGESNLVAHELLLQAGCSEGAQIAPRRGGQNLAQAEGIPPPLYAPQAAQDMRRGAAGSARRWSMDAWALWRRDEESPLLSGRPSYGRSQAGAVLRYHLAPASGHAPQLHLRGSWALEGRQEREVALGASARPLPGVPLRLAAEARVSETDRGTEARAAAYAVTELPPVGLPGGFTGEIYAQGGYVGGDFATPFADGQVRITRALAGTGDFRLEAGGGAWGGVQEDAGRLDIGPSAAVSFRIGPARGRVSADYRFRVAGDAQPASGPALTLSAGF